MYNFGVCGACKVSRKFLIRDEVLKQIDSRGEAVARRVAWSAVAQDLIRLHDSRMAIGNLARLQYCEALAMFAEPGETMNIGQERFVSYVFDELSLINNKVTPKGLHELFFICLALGLFGLYTLIE